MRRAKLIISLVYDAPYPTDQQINDTLGQAAEYLANNGLLTGEQEIVLDDWNYRIETQ